MNNRQLLIFATVHSIELDFLRLNRRLAMNINNSKLLCAATLVALGVTVTWKRRHETAPLKQILLM
jgi:hypothetical protein